jgi:hypothetical protein
MRLVTLVGLVACGLSGCVSSNGIQAIQVGDTTKSCEILTVELNQLGVQFEQAKDESGFTGKNVGMAILFWPGIFVNESRASKNESAVQQRVQYLTGLYNTKCLNTGKENPTTGS